MARFILLIMTVLGFAMPAAAQNSIDAVLDNYSAAGPAKFTSAVERDPATGKVKRVVKVLEQSYGDPSKFIRAFMDEADTGTLEDTRTDEGRRMLLTVETPSQNRFYMLHDKRRANGATGYKVTAIIIFKRK